MRLTSFPAAVFLAVQSRVIATIPNCPYNGPSFPPPIDLASSGTVQRALEELTEAFNGLESDSLVNPNRTSWSVQIFSTTDGGKPLWEHYHTAPNLKESTTPGVKQVDGDTIYRLGSATKIFTMFTFLYEAGEQYLNDPITKWVPELAALAGKADDDPVLNVDWDGITLGAIAAHMAGIVRDLTEFPRCGEWIPCSRKALFDGIANVPPSFAPSETAGYSNLGYQLLAYALEAITGKNYVEMIEDDIIGALKLRSTYYRDAPKERGIIPQGFEAGYNYSLGQANATGNMWSTVNDLSALGRHIFSNTLLTRPVTQRWIRPVTPTSDIVAGIGSPWGLRRIRIGDPTSTNRIVDSYGKAGSINVYQSLMILIPDYEIGMVALLAGEWPGNANWHMADVAGPILIPRLEEAAREQAERMYAGTYTWVNTTSTDRRINSTVTFTTDPDRPGLGVENWISNSTDMQPIAIYFTLPGVNAMDPSIRIFPTGLETRNPDGSRKVAFKAVIENLDDFDHVSDMFSTNCGKWVSQSAVKYASRALDTFVFDIDADGNVVSVQNQALRLRLQRQET